MTGVFSSSLLASLFAPVTSGTCKVVSGIEQFYNYGAASNPKGSSSTMEGDDEIISFYTVLDKSGRAYFGQGKCLY